MNIGNAIQMCRIRRQLSQAELAKLAGCSVSYLSMLENSKRDPTLSTIENIASGLGVPVEILFFLGADKGELTGIDKGLAGQLAMTALDLLNEPASAPPSVPPQANS
ncbi:helix-turn-helix domain-containing protein [Stenotrophomonas indicatrix]|uniref:helix-turn-helix transcriptional regulator n=1 Tax=Stenotrophomonas indicatrix TaxID=2045451 RepID=UPI002A96C16D|nr:helix-turn-helix transcriptional regulator [Stenotrophomonas maltophilia]HEL4288888.1 helix-turn-helix transcriptional regulator [Stenotrophomonas maltophilia]